MLTLRRDAVATVTRFSIRSVSVLRPTRRLLAAAAIIGAVLVGSAAPASAHAILESTDPPSGAAFDVPPRAITLHYDESVQASLGSVRVFDAQGHLNDTARPIHPGGDGKTIRVELPHLAQGSYVVTWRVISADAHPVRGAFTFRVGAANENVDSLTQRLLSAQGGSTTVGVLYAVARFAIFASLVLLVGAATFLAIVWPDGRRVALATRLVWGAWWGALVSTVLGFALQGTYGAALPLTDALKPDVWSDVWHARYGKVAVARVVLLVLVLPLLRVLLARRDRDQHDASAPASLPSWWPPVAALVALGLVFTPGLAGHASTGRWVPLALPADALHVGAVSVWLGGLVVLALALLRYTDADTLAATVQRFSRIALVAVIVIVVSGAFQAVRQVGTLNALTSTDYGRLLLAKLVAFAGLVVVAAFSRDIVNRHYRRSHDRGEPAPEPVLAGVGARGGAVPEPEAYGTGAPSDVESAGEWVDPDDAWLEGIDDLDDATAVRRLRRSVGLEVVVGAVILAVSSLLVNAAPARNVANAPVSATLKTKTVWFDLLVAPAKAGPNEVHLTALTPTGGLADPPQVTAELSEPDKDIAPIKLPLERLGPGHYIAQGFQIPFVGKWRLTVKALVTDVDEVTVTQPVPVH